MLMFPPPMLGAAYTSSKAKAVEWATKLLGTSEASVKQSFNDIEGHDGAESSGGITDITVTITAGARNADGNRNSLTASETGGPFRLFHHSAGKVGTSNTCTTFWIVQPAQVAGQPIAKIVMLAKHAGADTYQIMWMAGAGFTFGRQGGVTPKAPVPTVGATICPFKVKPKT